ncbi:MAG: phosphatidate cytidylyltransferase [Sphingomonadales bacterium]
MSELTKRILSGVVLAVSLLGILWMGGWWFAGLLVGATVILAREYVSLIWKGWASLVSRILWIAFGLVYIGLAIWGLWLAREQAYFAALLLFMAVWATDVGAYIFGRTIGGPKIAPRISPSKTWAGLLGAIIATIIVVFSVVSLDAKINAGVDSYPWDWGLYICLWAALACAVLAILAQAGDFFESWLKRRAGVKDSGTLIPGHGGLFDRVDGLLPIAAIFPVLAQVAFPT